ncbi:MAG: sodium export ATP-binding protein natA [Candidatus Improbicoccus devescovinae]|nr:MAG: sodium export ATP-binding protein natA [Candidatus Improbicoccus devescovinae]
MLKVRNICKSFSKKKKKRVLNDISFDLNKGEVLGLIGENGAGKTTLLRILSTMLIPDSGEALVNEYDLVREPDKIRNNIGILFGSEVGLYDRLSVFENLEYFAVLGGMSLSDARRRIMYLADEFEFNEYINKLAYVLSKGMKQKVAIARAIITDPKIMLFDEPDSGLDFKASRIFFKFLEECKSRNKSVIFSSHSMWNIKLYSDRIMILRSGVNSKIIDVTECKNMFSDQEFNEILYNEICGHKI